VAQDWLRYDTTVAGIPLGKVRISVQQDAPDYRVTAVFKMIPLLRRIFNGDAKASVEGVVAQGRYLPRTSEFRYVGRSEEEYLAIAFDEQGAPIDLRADPPIRQTGYRMTLGEAAGAVDPATAVAVLMTPRAQPCALSFDVFDGTKRHRITLTGRAAPAQNEAITCGGLYERVNGFKDKYMTPERRSWPFRATLAPGGDGQWVPLKITADTKFGPASATLRR